jgi:hypothetical protein
MATVVPGVKSLVDFVSLVNGIYCFLDIPETISVLVLSVYGETEWDRKGKIVLVDGDVIPDSSELALEADTCWVIGA